MNLRLSCSSMDRVLLADSFSIAFEHRQMSQQAVMCVQHVQRQCTPATDLRTQVPHKACLRDVNRHDAACVHLYHVQYVLSRSCIAVEGAHRLHWREMQLCRLHSRVLRALAPVRTFQGEFMRLKVLNALLSGHCHVA